jgi:electron transfer flavoprotein beta subunit
MNIVVPVKLVPDLVEEITVDAAGADLDRRWLRLIINEFDDHAIEQAILLKESAGARVTVIAAESDGVDDVLFTAAAKDADRLIKIVGAAENLSSHALASTLASFVRDLEADIILTGVQANDDMDGAVGPLLAEHLGMPYVGYVAGISVEGSVAVVRKEYPGGLVGEMRVALPAVLGIQAAAAPPRYVAVSKVRQAMRSASIEEREDSGGPAAGAPVASRMYQPEPADSAAMLEGSEEEVSDRLVEVFRDLGIL